MLAEYSDPAACNARVVRTVDFGTAVPVGDSLKSPLAELAQVRK